MNVNAVEYSNLDEFYAEKEDRRTSPEADYGVHWRRGELQENWRVSYVRKTGEVYAVRLSHQTSPVWILGIVPPDPDEGEGRRYYRTLDGILEGWEHECGNHESLLWVRQRLASFEAMPGMRDIILNPDKPFMGGDASEGREDVVKIPLRKSLPIETFKKADDALKDREKNDPDFDKLIGLTRATGIPVYIACEVCHRPMRSAIRIESRPGPSGPQMWILLVDGVHCNVRKS